MRLDPASQNFIGGVALAVLGALALLDTTGLVYGELRRMGPGYFPAIVSVLIIVVGVALAASSLFTASARIERPNLRALLIICACPVAFALALRPLGLVVASVAVVFIAGLAGRELKLRQVAVLCVVLLAIVLVVFKIGLALPIPLLPGA